MCKSGFVLAMLGTLSVPATSQTALTAIPGSQQKPQTVKKVVCERVDVEETTGSRLGSAPKRCKTVEVPVRKGAQQPPAPTDATGNKF